jgi:hypothetical protein
MEASHLLPQEILVTGHLYLLRGLSSRAQQQGYYMIHLPVCAVFQIWTLELTVDISHPPPPPKVI